MSFHLTRAAIVMEERYLASLAGVHCSKMEATRQLGLSQPMLRASYDHD